MYHFTEKVEFSRPERVLRARWPWSAPRADEIAGVVLGTAPPALRITLTLLAPFEGERAAARHACALAGQRARATGCRAPSDAAALWDALRVRRRPTGRTNRVRQLARGGLRGGDRRRHRRHGLSAGGAPRGGHQPRQGLLHRTGGGRQDRHLRRTEQAPVRARRQPRRPRAAGRAPLARRSEASGATWAWSRPGPIPSRATAAWSWPTSSDDTRK